jgi:acetyltransferase-like isoleucine patch superfamily enzyme
MKAHLRKGLKKLLRCHPRKAYTGVVLLLYGIAATALGLAAAPALALIRLMFGWAARVPAVPGFLLQGLALGMAWFIFGMALLGVVALYNKLLPTRIGRYKGNFYSPETIAWFLHNGLFYLVRYTFLPFVTLTPFGVWFLKAMGMKIGRHAFINTENISDPGLLSIGDDVVIGGSVRICAHYGGGGKLTIAPVIVGDRVTLGLACCILGDVIIGNDAVILAESVLLPGSRVGEGETWGGVPARLIPKSDMASFRRVVKGDLYFPLQAGRTEPALPPAAERQESTLVN